jgi:hypothetical protein
MIPMVAQVAALLTYELIMHAAVSHIVPAVIRAQVLLVDSPRQLLIGLLLLGVDLLLQVGSEHVVCRASLLLLHLVLLAGVLLLGWMVDLILRVLMNLLRVDVFESYLHLVADHLLCSILSLCQVSIRVEVVTELTYIGARLSLESFLSCDNNGSIRRAIGQNRLIVNTVILTQIEKLANLEKKSLTC